MWSNKHISQKKVHIQILLTIQSCSHMPTDVCDFEVFAKKTTDVIKLHLKIASLNSPSWRWLAIGKRVTTRIEWMNRMNGWFLFLNSKDGDDDALSRSTLTPPNTYQQWREHFSKIILFTLLGKTAFHLKDFIDFWSIVIPHHWLFYSHPKAHSH